MSENERLAQLILEFCRNMLLEVEQSTPDDIVYDFLEFVRKENLR
jgi:hypothetical protein